MYYFTYGLLYLISLLPMAVLYVFADFLYLLIYYIVGYRKKVVMSNLDIAFPEKTREEKITIAKKFYRNFIDNFIEAIKLISASHDFIKKRFVGDPSVFEYLYDKGLRCQLHLGHNFNWELANVAMPLYVKQSFLVVYMPIGSKAFDKLFYKIRTRTGSALIPATDMKNGMLHYRDKLYILTLVADQAPGNMKKSYWLPFFGKPTPFVQGPERGARIGNIPVVFAHITKKKRGYYNFHSTIASENPGALLEGELTRQYISYLEKVITEHPEMWLWSHRRWKRAWDESYRSQWIGEEPLK
jgi:Kdo2-lipid IVA lauroyltransferase/acyltransferase